VWNLKGVERALYRLPQVVDAATAGSTVYVVEGEKDVHAAEELGVVATTCSGGAGKWRSSYSDSLKGAQVVIVADRDDVGRKHAQDVAASLRDVALSVQLVEPAEGKDLFDHLAAGKPLEALVPMVSPADSPGALKAKSSGTAKVQRRWRPFPTHLLPGPVREIVVHGAAALGCDEAMLAGPALVACAACVGNRALLSLKRTYKAPSVLWLAVVAESGQMKSPALDLVLSPLRKREIATLSRFEALYDKYQEEMSDWKALSESQRRAKPGGRPIAPLPPQRLNVSDVTTEAVAARLKSSPLGLLLDADELAAWFKSFDAYRSGGKGPDAQRWLSAYDAREWIVDRKMNPIPIAIPRAAVSVVGGIQPGLLHRALGAEQFESGLAARLLLVMPPRREVAWSEAEVDQAVQDRYATMLLKMLVSQPAKIVPDGALIPRVIRLTPEAKAHYVDWFGVHAQRQNQADGRDAWLLSKIRGLAPRIALAIHEARRAAGDPTVGEKADLKSMSAGTEIADWVAYETLRIYGTFRETDEEKATRQLVELIVDRFKGRLTARQLRDARRQYRGSGEADAALDHLVALELGQWEPVKPGPKGGKPTRIFVLNEEPVDDENRSKFPVTSTPALADEVEVSGPDRLEGQSPEGEPDGESSETAPKPLEEEKPAPGSEGQDDTVRSGYSEGLQHSDETGLQEEAEPQPPEPGELAQVEARALIAQAEERMEQAFRSGSEHDLVEPRAQLTELLGEAMAETVEDMIRMEAKAKAPPHDQEGEDGEGRPRLAQDPLE